MSLEYCPIDKNRAPAWCDRILWKCQDASLISSVSYARHEILSSDHRPVSGLFQLYVHSKVALV